MQKISILAKDKPLLLFFALAYGLAWLAWLPLVLSRSGIGILPFDLSLWTILPGSYAPLVAACIVQWTSARNLRIARLLPSPGRALLALALGWLLIALAFIFLPSIYLTGGSIRGFDWAALVIYAHSGPQALLMAGPIGEEPGWRGFALPKLQARFGPVPAVLLLGVVWALWHAPLFLVPSWGGTSPWVFSVLVVGLSLFMGLCFNLSNGSIVVTVLLHAVFNASSPVLGAFLGHASATANISPEVILALSFTLVAFVLIVLSGGRLGLLRRPTQNGA